MPMQETGGSDPRASRTTFLREQAVRLALSGYSLEDALNYLFGLHRTDQDDLAQQEQHRKSTILEQQAQLERRLEEAREAQKSARELIDRRQALESERRSLQARLSRLGAVIRSKRRQGRAAAIADQATRRIERARREPEEQLEVEFDIRRKIFQIEEACWEVNRSEYQRRTEILQEEIARIDKELESQKSRLEKLRFQGVTRTVAGFLVWAGYLGFAATGSAVSYVLYKRIPGEGGSPSEAIGHFIARLEQYGSAYGPLGEALVPILFLLLILSVFGGVVWACDFGLKKFDARWTGRPKKKKGRPDRSTSESTIPSSPLAQFFQLPFIERASFVQLLAGIPYLFAAGVLFFLMSASGSPDPGQSREFARSLAPNYIGAVYSLLATAAFILYALYIVLPRMESTASRPDGARPNLVKTNWELVTLLCSLILALAIAALAPETRDEGDLYSRVTWGSIAIAMTLSSMGLAYGLIFTGQFKDVEKSERMRRQIRTAIESFGARPTIEIGELLNVEAIKNRLDDMHEEEESFEFIRTIYETTIAFSDEPGDFSSFLDLWLKAVEPKGKVRNLFSRSKLVESLLRSDLDTLDFEHAPDESSEVHELNLQILQCEAELRRIDQELPVLQANASSLQEAQKELEQLQASARAAQVELDSSKRALDAQRSQEELMFRAAFGLGQRFRPSNPPPPPPPPPTGGGGELPF